MDSQCVGFDSCADDDDDDLFVETVEILRRPGQTLGFYIREGNGTDRTDGVFISRIASGSVVESNDLLRVSDEILAVDKIDVQRMSLDDVAILMSIPKRLVLTIRRRRRPSSCPGKNISCPSLTNTTATSTSSHEAGMMTNHPSSRSTAHHHLLHPQHYHQQHPHQNQQQQPVFVRKGRVASVGDVADHEDFRSSAAASGAGVHFRSSGGTVNPGFRLSMDVARSLSLRGHGSTGLTSVIPGLGQSRQEVDRRLKESSVPRMRERAVDILDELIGQQQQQRQWRRSQRWQDDRKSSVDSTGSGSGCLRRRVDYSSDSEAQCGSERVRFDQQGSSTDQHHHRLLSESALYNGNNAFNNEAILDRSGLMASCLRSLSRSRDQSPERYSSDSEVGRSSVTRGNNDRSQFTGRHGSYMNRLFGRNDRCNTLPQKLQSSSSSVNSDELRHWLQKLDNLAFELEGQQLTSTSGHSNINTNTGSADSVTAAAATAAVGIRRCRTLSASSETEECYTAQEYRSWIDRHSPSSIDPTPPPHLPPPPPSSSTSSTAAATPLSSRTSSSRSTNITRKLSADSLLDYRTYHPTPPDPTKAHPSTDTQQTLQRRLFPASSSSSTWRTHRSSSTSSKSSSLAVATPRTSRHSTPSPSPSPAGGSTTLDPPSCPSSFPQGLSSKPLSDRLAASSILKDLQAAKKPIQLKTEDFLLYPGTSSSSSAGPEDIGTSTSRRTFDLHHHNHTPNTSSSSSFDGSIYVHIFCGHGLKASRTRLRDLYCVIAVDSVNKARTMIRTGAINFDWDEDFELDVISARRVSFLVYSWDPTTKHQLGFSSVLSLQTLLRHRKRVCRLALRLDPKGILYVELVLRDPGCVFQRLPSSDQSAIFGVALEIIVRRDAASDNIPIVLRRCIEEVERRGLNHAGLYRLCGSARRKEQLKADFEMNPTAVDLSPQSISDINVITGVVKDFLQQLPEPIFTTGLYQMLLDAISVRIPEDPSGSSKLMFSVLDCLPKLNQDVVSFLLNHLKRISRKSETNKMDSSSLANCFGPLTLCPPYQTTTTTSASTSTSAKEADFKKQVEVLRYVIDIWPEEKDGCCLNRSPIRSSDDASSSPSPHPTDLRPTTTQDLNAPSAKTVPPECNRTSTTALVHNTPPKTSFC